MQLYCLKCQKRVEVSNPELISVKYKSSVIQGLCPDCGNKVYRLGKAKTDNAITT